MNVIISTLLQRPRSQSPTHHIPFSHLVARHGVTTGLLCDLDSRSPCDGGKPCLSICIARNASRLIEQL